MKKLNLQAKLIEKQKEYIKLLGDEISKNAVYLHIHGMNASPEVIKQGEDLRADIKNLEADINKFGI